MTTDNQVFCADGISGLANSGNLTSLNLIRLGRAAGRYIQEKHERRPSVIIGKDTRLSCYMVEAALVAGFTSAGIDVKLTGPIPSSGVSLLARTLRADMGVMITASHNKFIDNGIKFFGPTGSKLSNEAEEQIQSYLYQEDQGFAEPEDIGRVVRFEDTQARYVEMVKSTLPRQMTLSGLDIVMDCANGAGYRTAPLVLWELGADSVVAIGNLPDGANINLECGLTFPETLSAKVREVNADVGIALDGEGDRFIMCDENGKVIGGDQIIGLIAKSWSDRGLLSKEGIVCTANSKIGLERYVEKNGIKLIRTTTEDPGVFARMKKDGYNLGEERSGHILTPDFAPTGDGMIAALQVLFEIAKSEKTASEIFSVF